MKYFIAIFVTAVIVFLGATVYYKGLPSFPEYSKTAVSTQSGVTVESTETIASSTALPSASPTSDVNSVLIAAVKAALVAEHGQDAESLVVTVSKIEGNYAQGDASAQAGGAIWYAAKIGEDWKLVWDGNGQIDCSSLSSYPNFPTDMISECWDTATNKVVTR
ncbi:MAG: hypothetical protein ABSC49_02265 [Candidatus Microgenomates bacterium]